MAFKFFVLSIVLGVAAEAALVAPSTAQFWQIVTALGHAHPQLVPAKLFGDSKAGQALGAVHPHLAPAYPNAAIQKFEGNLDGILSDYAPGAVLFTPDGPLRGVDAMRPLFQAMIAEFGKPGATFSMKQQSIEGDYAYILWTAETADNVYELGTDTFVVRDGKIVAQSFAGKITRKG